MRVKRSNSRRWLKVSSDLFEKLERRQLFSVLTVGASQTYTTIQSAVNAASPGDTINVTPGTYTEQVTIPSTLTGLTIEAVNPQASPSTVTVPPSSTVAQVIALFPDAANSSIIAAPASMTGNKAIIDVNGASNVTITGFVIEGPSTGIGSGVLVDAGATNVVVDYNHINHVHDNPISGNQTGVGVQVQALSSANVHDNFVSDYQKNGIFITGSGTIGTVAHNVIVGQGPSSVIDQNGIVFNSSATGSASNNLVTGNVYTPGTREDGGIELFNSGAVSVTNNISYNNDGDIIVDGPSNGSTISGNETYGATLDGIDLFDSATGVTISNNNTHNNGIDGIYVDSTVVGGNTISNNVSVNNGTYDYEDHSTGGTGSYGTGNTYSGDTGNTTNFGAATPPVITINPTNQSNIPAGTIVSFNAFASGITVPTVQWQISTDGGNTWGIVSGGTSLPLSFPAMLSENGDEFRAVFVNPNGGPVTTTAATLTVIKASPTISTTQQPATATAGSSIADMATVSGGDSPTGTVTFGLYNNSAGTGTALFTDTETLTGGTTTGTIAASPTGATESGSTVTITTTSTFGVGVGNSVTIAGVGVTGYNGTFTVVSAPTPTTFTYTDTNTGLASSGGGTASFTVPFTATSKGYTATVSGTDYWVATYSGDSNDNSAASVASAEPVTVSPGVATHFTVSAPSTAAPGVPFSITVTALDQYGNTATGYSGTVHFTTTDSGNGVVLPANYTFVPGDDGVHTFTNGVTLVTSGPQTVTATDTVTGSITGKTSTITVGSLATPTITTTQQPGSATVGSSIADKATLSGGNSPSGTVTFNLYSNPSGTGTPVFTDTEALSSGTATSKGYTTAIVSTYSWVDTYNGDSNNSPVTSGLTAEPVTINQASPTVITTQQPASVTVGGVIADQATVSGGFNPTGNITFKLFNNPTGTGTPVFIDVETLSGGTATSKGYTTTATGTFYWVDSYAGDGNNLATASGPAAEPVTVNPATVTGDTIFSPSAAPASNYQNVADPNITTFGGVDVGIKFTSDVAGTVTGVRFYKGSLDTGTHMGELWSNTGTLLASVTFTGESASGWQQASFSSPVTITASTVYIIAYHTTAGYIAYTPNGLSTGIDNPPLHALANGVSGGDGVYHYDSTPGNVVFPNQYNGQAPNYWVDVVFSPSTATTVTIFSPTSAPATPNVPDPNITAAGGVDVGIKFTSDVSGLVDGVRFYKGTLDTGIHIGELWSSTGTLLAQVTFTGETASGWQQANFSTPVSISANTTYIIAYHTSAPDIAYTVNGLASSIDNAPLHALASAASGGDGVYSYDVTPGTPVFPSHYNGQAPNYWVDVVFSPSTPTDTIFSPSSAPAANFQNVQDTNITSNGGVEVGTKFESSVSGFIDGVLFYKGSLETGVQTGELWTAGGTLLATATFTNETASGWQQVSFSSPVAIAANTVYIVSYHTTSQYIAYTPGGLASAVNNPPLTALANGTSGGNGVYAYGASSNFPSLYNGQAPNYWVDVLFTP